ncbi:DUF1616 domain-containing protein [Chloroflexota bacterium]
MDWLSPIRELFGFVFPLLEHLPIVRAILGFILVLFLPGFAWTFVFFREINVIERIALSFGLSIGVVTLSVLIINRLIETSITGFNSTLVILVITVVPVAAYYLNSIIRRKRGNTT